MKKIILISSVVIAFASCHDYPDFDNLSYKPIVVTNHDPSVNFNDYQTYYMSDNLTLIGDDPSDTVVSSSIGDPIVAAIKENMATRGFTRVLSVDSADLGINSAVIKITTTVQTYPPYYWWGYPGYGSCYYGYCGGGYYPYYGYGYSYSYSYSTGSLMLQMADLKNVNDTTHSINIVWTNFNTGVLGTTSQNVQGGVNSVNQAFIQSPYLKTN